MYDARFQMRCGPSVTVILVAVVLLASLSDAARRPNSQSGPTTSPLCKSNVKSSLMASQAAKEAKDANDAQCNAAHAAELRVKSVLADKATQAAKAAEVALSGKKQLLDELAKNLCETQRVMEEIKRIIGNSSCGMKAELSRQHLQKNVNMIRTLYSQMIINLKKFQQVATSAQRETDQKRRILEAAKLRLDELHACVKQGRDDLEANRQFVKKAKLAAKDAKDRIDTLRQLASRIKTLKRKDLNSLKRYLRQNRKHRKTPNPMS
ncbi:hypothetical protein KR018_010287 [Drosophila ironensis]|nr:hypothetical protein KR018_010287 [Drosophila ironensis]